MMEHLSSRSGAGQFGISAERPVSIHDINRFYEREFRRWLRRRGNPMQLLQGFEKDLCQRASRAHACCIWQSQRTSRRRAMRVTRYARDLRPECGMAPDRMSTIDRVASRPRQRGLNPHQQPSPLALLTLSSDGQRRRLANKTHAFRRHTRRWFTCGPNSADYIHPKWLSTVFEVVTKGDDYIVRSSFLDEVHRR